VIVIKSIDVAIIAKKFLVKGYNIEPSAAKMLLELNPKNIDEVITEICRVANGKFIISVEDVKKAISAILNNKKRTEVKIEKREKKEEIKVLKDITGSSFCEGKVEDFIAYFNSRFEKLSKILRNRIRAVEIANIGKIRGEEVEVIGMISNIREISEGYLIELEDKTGRINCIATGKLREIAEELLGDEVIGVSGTVRGKTIIANRIIFPDIPINGKKINKKDFYIVFISDTHFGSREFLEKKWKKFVEWLNGEAGNGKIRDVASRVKYVIVAGDIVDGVGVYPGQENDLEIIDIYKQYEKAAMHFDEIPSDIKIIVSPGNHDAVRQAEPQPALPKEIRKIFSNNVKHVGNPALVDLEGVKVLIYHGRSLDDVITKIPRLSYDKPHEAMEELLKRRHLCPIYGGKTPIAPEKEDYLVIDEIPDIIHSGHVHTYGAGFYRGVLLINSSTWQAQTEFQKKMNLNPNPCNVAVYRPGGELIRLRF